MEVRVNNRCPSFVSSIRHHPIPGHKRRQWHKLEATIQWWCLKVRHLNILLRRLFCDSSNVQQTTLQIKFTYSEVRWLTGQLLRFIPPQPAAKYYQRQSLIIGRWRRFQLVSRILLEASRILIKITKFHFITCFTKGFTTSELFKQTLNVFLAHIYSFGRNM